MTTKFSQFASGGVADQSAILVGLKNGANTQFTLPPIGGVEWSLITSSQTMSANSGYIADSAIAITLTMPSSIALGDVFEVADLNSGGWVVQLHAGQTIRIGNITTSSGGSVSSTDIGDCIRLVAVDSTRLIVLSGVTVDFSST